MYSNRSLPEEKKNEAIQFSANDLALMYKHGIPPAAATELLLQSHTTLCSIRGNDSEKPATTARYRRSCALKPGYIQAKTCNAGPARSYVCDDHAYSKFEINEKGDLEARKIKPGDIPPDQPIIPLVVSLQEIIHGINSGDYSLVSFENNEIIYRLEKGVPLINQQDLFKIKLSEFIAPEKIDNPDAIEINNQIGILPQPIWWNESKAAKYSDVATYDFKQYYTKPQEIEYKEFKVLGIKQGDRILPIVSDIDQFMLGIDQEYLKKALDKVPRANTPILAMDKYPENVRDLYRVRYELEVALLEISLNRKLILDPAHAQNDIVATMEIKNRIDQNAFVKGNITPLESLYSDLMNDKFFEKMPHLKNLFQHASEVRNPYDPSKMGAILFFMDGKMHELNGENEISKFLQEKALPKFVFDIHYKWNMEYFGPIIKQQLDLGPPHRVLDETFKAYEEWVKQSRLMRSSNKEPDHKEPNKTSHSEVIGPKYEDEFTRLKNKSAIKSLLTQTSNNRTDENLNETNNATKPK